MPEPVATGQLIDEITAGRLARRRQRGGRREAPVHSVRRTSSPRWPERATTIRRSSSRLETKRRTGLTLGFFALALALGVLRWWVPELGV